MEKKLLAKLVAGIFGTAPFLASINQAALASTTDVAQYPLANRRSSDIKPNIMLVLDDSGSMQQDYMPDDSGTHGSTGPSYRSHLCNTIYYNPNPSNTNVPLSPYLVPKTPVSGSLVEINTADPASFTAAYDNGYWTFDQIGVAAGVAGRTDLSADQGYGGTYDATGRLLRRSGQGAYYWKFAGTAAVTPSSGVCNAGSGYGTAIGICAAATALSDPGAATYAGPFFALPAAAGTADDAHCVAANVATPVLLWKRVVISATSGLEATAALADERERFANWYSYYRSRMQMTKSAIGRAFLPLASTDKYRVGFITIAPQQLDNGAMQSSVYGYDSAAPQNSKFLEIGTFGGTQANNWFNILFAQRPNGETPLREGLSRVGRYYGGKTDGPNTGMITTTAPIRPDPVRYACQQNFSILTTDGYWNVPPARLPGMSFDGGFKLDLTIMGNEDGNLLETDAYSENLAIGARPIYDGTATSTDTTTDATNAYRQLACNYWLQSTTQIISGTVQNLKSTAQVLQTDYQRLQTTFQALRNTNQNLQSTSQLLQTQTQKLQTTFQALRNTNQNLQNTSQWLQAQNQKLQTTNQALQTTTQVLLSTAQLRQILLQQQVDTLQMKQSTVQNLQSTLQRLQSTVQNLQTTNQALRNTNQNLQSTSQLAQSQLQQLRTTNQALRTTNQAIQTTVQATRTTTQSLQNTLQNLQTTTQNLRSTNQNWLSTRQVLTCDNFGADCVGTQTCTPVAEVSTCSTVTTGPTAVSACTSTSASSGNSWITTSCPAPTTTSNVPVSACTSVSASAGNSWVTTSCSNAATSNAPVSACTATSASAGNNWITTTCPAAVSTSNVPVASCTSTAAGAGNSWVATTCPTTIVSSTPLASCAAVTASAGNSWVTTSCSTTSASNSPVSACTSASASAGNSWITTTCPTPTIANSNVAVSACTSTAASSGNSWVTTTCPTPTIANSNVPVSACTSTAASAGNSWITTTCPAPTISTSNVGVSACTSAAASAGNSWVTTSCSTIATSNVPISSCSPATASSGNSWVNVTCPAPITTSNVAFPSCTPTTASSGNSWVTTTCPTPTIANSNVPVSACTSTAASSGNSWVTTTCPTPTIATSNVPVSACTSTAASSGNSWIRTTCASSATSSVPILSCTSTSASAGNSWVTTTCPAPITTSNVAVSACAVVSASAGNSWIATTVCSGITTGPTVISACTAVAANSGNSWVTTNCSTITLSSTAVSTCTSVAASAGNSWVTTVCATATTGPNGVSSCVAVPASAGNSWIATLCASNIVSNTAVAACTSTAASSGNSWITTTCPTPTIANSNVPVSACTSTAPSAGNSWITTTCPAPTIATSNVPVSACTSAAASSGNSWVTTSCSNATASNVPIAACSSTAASSGNSWVTTTCPTPTIANSTFAVSACTSTAASSGNSWVTTTCPTPTIANSNVAVSACTSTAASNGNSWITTTCPAPTIATSNVPVSACTSAAGASGNSWITTSCSTVATSNVPIASCNPATASSGNSWVNVTCPTPTISNSTFAVSACTSTAASSGNSWVTTTCPTPTIANSNVPVAACTSTAASNGNSWITTTCPAPTIATSNVPVAACSTAAAGSGNSWVTTSCSNVNTTNVPILACTDTSASSGNSWVTTTCASSVTVDVPVSACAAASASAGNSWVVTTCTTNTVSLGAVQSCTVIAASLGNSWITTNCDVQPGQKNQYQTTSKSASKRFSDTTLMGSTASLRFLDTWVDFWTTGDTGTDVNGTGSLWSGASPAAVVSPWTDMSLCVDSSALPATPAAGRPGSGDPVGPASVASLGCTSWPCTITSNTPSGGSSNSLADVAQYYYKTDLRPEFSNNTIAGTSSRGSIEGDVAGWQHMTTFTMGLGVSGAVKYNKDYITNPLGTATASIPNEDFQKIRCQWDSKPLGWSATNVNGDPNLCLNWPVPREPATSTEAVPENVDDLWHAAVNGRGQYFSASDPDAVFSGLTAALKAIEAQSGSGSGATTATQDPVEGNNLTFSAGYRTVDWTGDIVAKHLYVGTNTCEVTELACTSKGGRVTSACPTGGFGCDLAGTTTSSPWSAQDKLASSVGNFCDNRSIYAVHIGATNNLVPFTWNTRICSGGAPAGVASTGLDASEQALFTSSSLTTPEYSSPFNMNDWSQYVDMFGTHATLDQRPLAQGANLVNFLRGQRGMEGYAQGDATRLFRARLNILGDIIGSQPRYVSVPSAQFTDTGYALFKQDKAGRAPMLYVGANDGMLHALKVGNGDVSDVNGGVEAWAVIPSTIMPNLYRLANTGYSDAHRFFVDATPSAGDVFDKYATVSGTACDGTADSAVARYCWKTILVGGLGAGGRGYFALDITDPSSAPKALWEFKQSSTCYDDSTAITRAATNSADCHLGLSFGAPLITKLVDGTWVAIVSSGVQNDDGQGYLYVLDAMTGKIIKRIGMGVGDTTSPADFAYINAYVENYIQNNTAERVYGGDMLGNVWRIDLSSLSSTAGSADVVKLATVLDPTGNPQPITTTPQMMNIGEARTRMVYVATGRYLGEADLAAPPQRQTVYALAEDLSLHSDSTTYIANGNTVLPSAGLTLRQQLNQVVLSAVTGQPDRRQAASPVCSAEATAAAAAAGLSTSGCMGWYADLPDSGERVNLDPHLALGSLTVISNVPLLASCDSGGSSWTNVFDAATGEKVPGADFLGQHISGALSVGSSLIRDQLGRILSIITKSDGTQEVRVVPTQQASPLGRRSSWRDLLDK